VQQLWGMFEKGIGNERNNDLNQYLEWGIATSQVRFVVVSKFMKSY